MTVKRRPHHDLFAVQAKFGSVDTLEITRSAVLSAREIGFGLAEVVDAVQALEPGDFVKSETAHNALNRRIWHDSYRMPWRTQDGESLWLYLKFAGETLIDVVLTSFKEV